MLRNIIMKPGLVLLSIWLILTGLISLADINVNADLLAVVAIIAGILVVRNIRTVTARENLGILLLGIWLIVIALRSLIDLNFSGLSDILAFIEGGAGIFLLVALGTPRRAQRNLGYVALSAFLILSALLILTTVNFSLSDEVLAVLAIAAGVLILIRR